MGAWLAVVPVLALLSVSSEPTTSLQSCIASGKTQAECKEAASIRYHSMPKTQVENPANMVEPEKAAKASKLPPGVRIAMGRTGPQSGQQLGETSTPVATSLPAGEQLWCEKLNRMCDDLEHERTAFMELTGLNHEQQKGFLSPQQAETVFREYMTDYERTCRARITRGLAIVPVAPSAAAESFWNRTDGRVSGPPCLTGKPIEFIDASHAAPLTPSATIREMGCVSASDLPSTSSVSQRASAARGDGCVSWAAYNAALLRAEPRSDEPWWMATRLTTWSLCGWNGTVLGGGAPGATRNRIVLASLSADLTVRREVLLRLDGDEATCRVKHTRKIAPQGLEDPRLFWFQGTRWLLVNAVNATTPQNCDWMMLLYRLPSTFDEVASVPGRHKFERTALTVENPDARVKRLLRSKQKNWMPFVVAAENGSDEELFMILALEPIHVVLKVNVNTGRCKVVHVQQPRILHADSTRLMHLRGGAPAVWVPAIEAYLGIAHVTSHRRSYSHFFFTFGWRRSSKKSGFFELSAVSPQFCFSHAAGPARISRETSALLHDTVLPGECELVQFVTSMVLSEDAQRLVLSYGVGDCDSRAVSMSIERVVRLLAAGNR